MQRQSRLFPDKQGYSISVHVLHMYKSIHCMCTSTSLLCRPQVMTVDWPVNRPVWSTVKVQSCSMIHVCTCLTNHAMELSTCSVSGTHKLRGAYGLLSVYTVCTHLLCFHSNNADYSTSGCRSSGDHTLYPLGRDALPPSPLTPPHHPPT